MTISSGSRMATTEAAALAQPGAEVAQQLQRGGVALLGGTGDVVPTQRLRVVAAQLGQASRHRRAGRHDVTRLPHRALPLAYCSQQPRLPQPHRRPSGTTRRWPSSAATPDAPRSSRLSTIDTAADPGPDGHEHHVVGVAAHAVAELAPRRGVGVVLDDHRDVDDRLQALLERLVAPGQVGREQHRRPRLVDEPGARRRPRDDVAAARSARGRRPPTSWAIRSASCAGVSRRARAITFPSLSTTPPLIFVPPMSRPTVVVTTRLLRHCCRRRRPGCPGP